MVMRGPGIPAGTVCDELTGTIDVLPTIASITGKPLPEGKKIDGMDVSGLWMGTTEKSPRTEFVHYTSQGNVEGLRQENWKLLVKKPRRARNRQSNLSEDAIQPEIMLFDLSKDVREQNNVAEENPQIVGRLRTRMEELDAEITENARVPWTKQ